MIWLNKKKMISWSVFRFKLYSADVFCRQKSTHPWLSLGRRPLPTVPGKKKNRGKYDTGFLCYRPKKNVMHFPVYWSDFLSVCVNCLLFHKLGENKRRFADRDWCGIINPRHTMTSSLCTGTISRSASSRYIRHLNEHHQKSSQNKEYFVFWQ